MLQKKEVHTEKKKKKKQQVLFYLDSIHTVGPLHANFSSFFFSLIRAKSSSVYFTRICFCDEYIDYMTHIAAVHGTKMRSEVFRRIISVLEPTRRSEVRELKLRNEKITRITAESVKERATPKTILYNGTRIDSPPRSPPGSSRYVPTYENFQHSARMTAATGRKPSVVQFFFSHCLKRAAVAAAHLPSYKPTCRYSTSSFFFFLFLCKRVHIYIFQVPNMCISSPEFRSRYNYYYRAHILL